MAEREPGKPEKPRLEESVERRENHERRATPDVLAEVSRERKHAQASLAELFWKGPAKSIEALTNLGSRDKLLPLLETFARLGDDCLATERLRQSRKEAAQAAGIETTGV